MKFNVKKKDILIFIFLLLIVFQMVLENYIDLIKYFDELMAISFFVVGVVAKCSNKNFEIKRWELIIAICTILYLCIGFMSSLIYEYQNIVICIKAMFVAVKWFMLFEGTYLVSKAFSIDNICKININILKILVVIFFLWNIGCYINNSIFFSFATFDLTAKSVLLIILFVCNTTISDTKKIPYMLLLLILLIASRAAKGYAICAITIVVYVCIIKGKRHINIGGMAVVGVLAILCAWQDIEFYYLNGAKKGFARATMLITSIQIANDYFPFGTGFGTFGSYFSALYYSPVFYLYGLDNHLELGETRRVFINDAYLPILFAETGWIGSLLIGIILFTLLYYTNKMYKYSFNLYGAAIVCMIYITITLVEETGFQQPVLMGLAIFMGASLYTIEKFGYMREKT